MEEDKIENKKIEEKKVEEKQSDNSQAKVAKQESKEATQNKPESDIEKVEKK